MFRARFTLLRAAGCCRPPYSTGSRCVVMEKAKLAYLLGWSSVVIWPWCFQDFKCCLHTSLCFVKIQVCWKLFTFCSFEWWLCTITQVWKYFSVFGSFLCCLKVCVIKGSQLYFQVNVCSHSYTHTFTWFLCCLHVNNHLCPSEWSYFWKL